MISINFSKKIKFRKYYLLFITYFFQMKNIMSLPVESRYLCINDICKQFCQGNVKSTAASIGCCQNTVRSALNYCRHPGTLGHQGRTKKLKKHHLLFIEAQTYIEPHITNEQLAEFIKEHFDDITSCSANTVMRARHEIGFQ